MRAVILNNALEARLLDERGSKDEWDFVVPIGADARYFAEKKKWPLKLVRDFFTPETHEHARLHAEEVVRDVISRVNGFFQQSCSTLIHETGTFFNFDLYIILGQVLFTAKLLQQMLARCEIEIFENRLAVGQQMLGIRPHPDILLSSVAKVLAPAQCRITPYEANDSRQRKSAFRRLRAALPAGGVDFIYALQWARQAARCPNTWLSPKKKLLVLGGMFDWKPVVFSPPFYAQCRPTFRAFDRYPVMDCGVHQNGALSEIIGEAIFGERRAPQYFTRLANSINSVARYLERSEGGLERLVKSHAAVLTSVFVTPVQSAVGHLARKHRVPTICFQHGEMNLYPEAFGEGVCEMGYTTHYFAYGPKVVDKYRPYIGKTALQEIFIAGTTRKKPLYKGGNIVLYATGKWFKTARPFNHDADPDARLYEAQRIIIQALDEHARNNRDVRVVLKANNTEGFNEVPFSTSMEIDYTSRFTDLLRDAKLVVLDAPATTCIEAASTSVPLFVLAGRSPWYPEPARMLARRAVVESDPGILMERVNAYLNKGQYSADTEDRELAEMYGGSSITEGTVERVVEKVCQIISSEP